MPYTSKSIQEMGIDSLSDRVRDTLSCESNKPDFRELDLGSPVSPSSGSVSGKTGGTQLVKRPDGSLNNYSGELSASSETSPYASETLRSVAGTRNSRPGHRRSSSAGPPLIYSGASFVSSSNGGCSGGGASSISSNPNANVLPSGNICPSGKILKAGMPCRSSGRSDVLGSGTGHYGHGSIMRGGAKLSSPRSIADRAMGSSDPEEVKKAGNELYRRGSFTEALSLYDRAISLSPDNAAYRSNRAAALTALGKLAEAVKECEEAVRLDPGYGRAHQRLASLYLRLGQVENARRHLFLPGQPPDPSELQKLLSLEKHLNRCADARKIGDWKSALRECDAAIAGGADSSPQLISCRAEALLKLHQIEDADSCLSSIPKFEHYSPSCSTKFVCMIAEAYVLYVRAQVEMALGRFENAVAAAEKAGLIDYSNVEVAKLLNNVKLVARARARGNELFSSGRFSEACSAYGEGLKYDTSNSVLYCNRAVCWSKLGLWEKSVEDCNHALKIQPNYTKALLRRAVSNGKLGQWAEAVKDYEVLRRELPGDIEVAESLSQAQAALSKSWEEETHSVKFGGEVEEVSGVDQFKAAISSPGVSVVHFKVASNYQCGQVSPIMDKLCVQYPSIKFLKVDVEESPAVAKAESIKSVPTFKIYKNGGKVNEMICPSHQYLEYSVRYYSL
ncbi:unnamed protein product, partial [Vitis vinifera]